MKRETEEEEGSAKWVPCREKGQMLSFLCFQDQMKQQLENWVAK